MTTRTTRHLLRDFAASKTFRSTFVSTHAKRFIPLQLRDLFKQYKLTQLKLAALSGVPQGSISRALDVDYGNLTINTLTRLAAGLDVALVCKFVPFSTFLDGLDEEGDEVYVPSFDEEFGKQAKPAPVETAASKSNLTQFVARYTQPRERGS
jgi:transcriptional regulator with XRE-family HTH domain